MGPRLDLSPDHGEQEPVLIDLPGAGGLRALGIDPLTPLALIAEEGMALRWMNRLPQLDTIVLVGIGGAGALLRPENLVLEPEGASL